MSKNDKVLIGLLVFTINFGLAVAANMVAQYLWEKRK